MSDDLEQDTRKKIFELVSKNPGLHLSKIAESLHMRTSLAEYHLNYLEKNELVLSVKKEGEYYRRYYTRDSTLGVDDKKILAVLREEMLLKIIVLLLRKEKLRHKDILKHFDITPPTLSYYIQKLVVNGIIEAATYGEDKGYVLLNKTKVLRLLFTYEFHVVAEDFKALWDEFKYW